MIRSRLHAAPELSMTRKLRCTAVQALRIAVRDFFPTANGPLLRAAACMFTNTEDTRFVIDFHPTHSQVLPAFEPLGAA